MAPNLVLNRGTVLAALLAIALVLIAVTLVVGGGDATALAAGRRPG